MDIHQLVQALCREPEHGQPLERGMARRLFAAALDGELDELELGAMFTALRCRRESLAELAGFLDAAQASLAPLALPVPNARCVIIPSYSRASGHSAMLPLQALLIARHNVPVLVHGEHDADDAQGSFATLAALGHAPVDSIAAAQAALATHHIAVVPNEVLSPRLARLLRLRRRLGVANSAHLIARFLDPLPGDSLRVVCVANDGRMQQLGAFADTLPGRILLMRASEAQTFGNPVLRPRIELHEGGGSQVLYEAENQILPTLREAAPACDSVAQRIADMVEGRRAPPQPVLNQLAACLYASGQAPDLMRARARVALGAQATAA